MKKETIPHTYAPMELQPVKAIPNEPGGDWLFEPKWDGFRCLAFCREGDIDLRSKSGQPLARYFPEVVERLKKIAVREFVLDGELMVYHGKTPSFDSLLQRIHPAQSRVIKLAAETPATYIVFDLLVEADGKNGTKILANEILRKRHKRLEQFAAKHFGKSGEIVLSPATEMASSAKKWFDGKGTELDGVVAKHLDMPYQSGNRLGAVKIKRRKTADCVVGGFRYGTNSKDVGSLLLGLYDDQGRLHHVGFTSALAADEKRALTPKVEALATDKSFTVNVPGAPSRWNNGKETPWTALKPKLVVEISYDHFTDGRFRHGTKILRWRSDKSAKKCDFAQLE
jgi:ATP-dependent DNA ligase